MQRMKGQGTPVPNGPKDQNFSSFQSYSNPMTSSMAAPAPSDPYMSSFYMPSTPYQAFGVGDGTWSNGGEHMQTFLGGYGGQVGYDSHNPIDGIFNSGNFGGFNATGFNYGFHGNGDYSAWGSDVRSGNKQFDDYYQRGVYPEDRVKSLEQGVQGISLSDPKLGQEAAKDNNGISSATNGSDKVGGEGTLSSSTEGSSMGGISQPKKGLSWASVASQPAKILPSRRRDKTTLSSIVPGRHMDIGTWEGKNGGPKPVAPPPCPRPAWEAPRGGSRSISSTTYPTPPPKTPPQSTVAPPSVSPQLQSQQAIPVPPQQQPYPHQSMQGPAHQFSQSQPPMAQPGHHAQQQASPPQPKSSPSQNVHQGHTMHAERSVSPQGTAPNTATPQQASTVHEEEDGPTLDDLHTRNDYNPKEIEIAADNARFFVIKSYSEDDIHRSIKYEIWCSTEHGNKRLDSAFRERESKGPIYLFFSVNGSGHFCGIAQMISMVDYNSSSSVWAQDKWKGQFRVKWIYVKDVPNNQLRQIRLENNENKPVTNSRDTQEVPHDKGLQVIKIIHTYRHKTSIFDDFFHYEKRQEETEFRRVHYDVERDERHHDQNQRRAADPRMDYRDHPHDPRDPRDQRESRDPRDPRDPRDQREPHREYQRDYHRGGHGGRGRGGDYHRGHYQQHRGGGRQ